MFATRQTSMYYIWKIFTAVHYCNTHHGLNMLFRTVVICLYVLIATEVIATPLNQTELSKFLIMINDSVVFFLVYTVLSFISIY